MRLSAARGSFCVEDCAQQNVVATTLNTTQLKDFCRLIPVEPPPESQEIMACSIAHRRSLMIFESNPGSRAILPVRVVGCSPRNGPFRSAFHFSEVL